ncbi:VOC family protein [Schumannella soli]|uniref:VOC family protein n=1 Tax=Schumannella soli TaxID=2590779 RepID=A0A506Y8R3_9MICO|nr:VOC family protein [Schumannella soli]TPW77880.1 VOC family protein [Schumannella soli]
MGIRRFDHVGINVDDLDAAVAFFVALGLEASPVQQMEGGYLDDILALEGVRTEMVYLTVPGGVDASGVALPGSSAFELSRYVHPGGAGPDAPGGAAASAPNAHGPRHVCFEVDDLDASLAVVAEHGHAPLGRVIETHGYRLVYVRGPEGLIVELAQRLG